MERTEDEIIAWTWANFLESGANISPETLVRFPMCKVCNVRWGGRVLLYNVKGPRFEYLAILLVFKPFTTSRNPNSRSICAKSVGCFILVCYSHSLTHTSTHTQTHPPTDLLTHHKPIPDITGCFESDGSADNNSFGEDRRFS